MSAEDDRSLLAMRAAKMSTASIAMTMGWSERRVVGRFATLDAAAAAPDYGGQRDGCETPGTCRAKGPGLCPECHGRIVGRRMRTPPALRGDLLEVPAPAPVRQLAPRRPAPFRSSRRGVERLDPLTPAKRRFCGWFLAAGWGLEETAALFDVAADVLGEAFDRRAAA